MLFGSVETVMGKQCFEEWLREQGDVELWHYHGDNDIFIAGMFHASRRKKNQSKTISDVGAWHQNGHAEHTIQYTVCVACSFMEYTSLHWTGFGIDDLPLWSFSVCHMAWLYNLQSDIILLDGVAMKEICIIHCCSLSLTCSI